MIVEIVLAAFLAGIAGVVVGVLVPRAALRRVERRAQEAELRLAALTRELDANRDRLGEAMDGTRLAMWELDMRTGQVNLSANWWALMGGIPRESPLPIDELIDRVPDGEQADCWMAMRSVLRGEASFYDVDHRVRREDGSFAWIRSRGAVSERSSDGRVLRMSGTNLDITARKSAEQAKDDSESKLRLIADALPLEVIIVDTNLHVVYANRRFGETFGSKPEAMAGKSLRAIAGSGSEMLVRSRIDLLRSGATVTCMNERGLEELRLVPQLQEDLLTRIAIIGHIDATRAGVAGEASSPRLS
jgi:PAS domain-containing protein